MNATILLLTKEGRVIRATLNSLTEIRLFGLYSTLNANVLHRQDIFGGGVKCFSMKEVERWI